MHGPGAVVLCAVEATRGPTRCRWPLVPNKTCSMDHFGSKKGVEVVRLARLGQKSTFWFEWELFQLVGCQVFSATSILCLRGGLCSHEQGVWCFPCWFCLLRRYGHCAP